MARDSLHRRAIVAGLLAGASLIASAAKKPAPAPAPPPGTPVKAPPEPPERVIEKKDGDYILRLTIRPGNIKVNHVAEGEVEIVKALEIPDPVTGDQMPVTTKPIATINPPAPVGRGKKAPEPSRYWLYPVANPGTYSFHFTPEEDGMFDIAINGSDITKAGDEAPEPLPYGATFHVGVGTAAAQTEASVGGPSARHTTRRPVGSATTDEAERKLLRLMDDMGDHYLALEVALAHAPAKGAATDAAAEAQVLSGMFTQLKGQLPPTASEGADAYNALAAKAGSVFADVATAASGKDHAKAVSTFDAAESVGCIQCHAKYRYQVTDDVSGWPRFAQKVAP